MQRYLVALQCLSCAVERPHTVTYLGNVFASATCTVCGETVRPRTEVLIADYVRDFELRLVRKPGRMLSRARRHPVTFMLRYLPHGLVSKPREVLQEWETLVRLNAAQTRENQTRENQTRENQTRQNQTRENEPVPVSRAGR